MLELARQLVPIIICECELGDGNWKDVLSYTAAIAGTIACDRHL
jgi:hypothetical protein